MRIGFAYFALALQIAGCATKPPPEPIVQTVEVRVPVAVTCAVTVAKPTQPDTDAALAAVADIFAGSQLLLAGRLIYQAYIAELEAALSGCQPKP